MGLVFFFFKDLNDSQKLPRILGKFSSLITVLFFKLSWNIPKSPENTKHLHNLCTMSAQRLRHSYNIVQMLYKVLCLLGGQMWSVNVAIQAHKTPMSHVVFNLPRITPILQLWSVKAQDIKQPTVSFNIATQLTPSIPWNNIQCTIIEEKCCTMVKKFQVFCSQTLSLSKLGQIYGMQNDALRHHDGLED